MSNDYEKEAEQIKVINPGDDWKIPTFCEKKKPLKHVTKMQIFTAVIAALAIVAAGYAASTYLSNVIGVTLEVRAPETMSLQLQGWPTQIIQNINYSFSMRVTNTNPTLPGVFELRFSRADGIQVNDIDVYIRTEDNNYTKLTKTLDGNTLVIRSDKVNFPTGTITREFVICATRTGSYSVMLAIATP